MKDYLSIGKVSKLKNVSIKSLRYYDEIGILKPAYVNQETNYRYYKPEQLYLIDAINLCIQLGIPLKTLPDYQDRDGNWDFQKLLFDGKALAEDKIRSMRNSIEALQTTLRLIDSGDLTVYHAGSDTEQADHHTQDTSSASESVLPANTQIQSLDTRTILAVEFDIATTPERYNHKLLELFVGANKIGLNTAYPAGLYYEQKNNTLCRYVFVYLTEQSVSLPDSSPFIVRKLPAANYLCSQSDTHQIDRASELFAPLFDKTSDYQLIEQAITAHGSKDTIFELQYLSQEAK